MDQRIRVALIYINSKAWIAGTYYVQNLIYALNAISDDKKPILDIYCNSKLYFDELQFMTSYPYLNYVHYDIAKTTCKKILNRVKYIFNPYRYKEIGSISVSDPNTICIFPITNLSTVKQSSKALCWIPDFQERYYPQYFMHKELRLRKDIHKAMIKNNVPIVFSSEDSKQDFTKFYPEAKNPLFVMRFSVTHPVFETADINAIKQKYGLNGDYYFCANQFWPHKNHLFLFKVFKKYLQSHPNVQLACSGTLKDFRKGDSKNSYQKSILDFLENNNLGDHIKILGFISREEQLCLMANSISIIQPSLFEGWSTIVEDAKCLNKHIFLSNIDVHIEQKPANVTYFDPNSEEDLLQKLENTEITHEKIDYKQNIIAHGLTFVEILNSIKIM